MKKKKKSTQSSKQRAACLIFVKKYKCLTVERGRDDYLFLDQCPKYFFHLPNLQNHIIWGLTWLPHTR